MQPYKSNHDAKNHTTTPAPLAYTPDAFAALISTGDRAISARTIRHWCDSGRIPGARKIGKRWIIPASAVTTLFATGGRV